MMTGCRALLPGVFQLRHEGAALVAVLWIVVVLSILVGGMTLMARGELRTVQTQLDAVRMDMLMDGALRMAAQDLRETAGNCDEITIRHYVIGDTEVQVTVVPSSGLISLNTAPPKLLRLMFEVASGVDEYYAEELASSIVARRESDAGPLISVQALTELPGVSHQIYDKVRDLVSVVRRGEGLVDPRAAPLGVLRVLAGGDSGTAERIDADRHERAFADVSLDGLEAGLLSPATYSIYRLEVSLEDEGGVWLRTIWYSPGMELAGSRTWWPHAPTLRTDRVDTR